MWRALAFMTIAAMPAHAASVSSWAIVCAASGCVASDGTTQPSGTVIGKIWWDGVTLWAKPPNTNVIPDTGQVVYQPALPLRVDAFGQGALDVRRDCGAIGDGKADDSASVAACLGFATSPVKFGRSNVVYFPAGSYRLINTQLPVMGAPVVLQGDGPHSTYILVDKAYSGDVFAFSDVWMGLTYAGPSLMPVNDRAGATIKGLSIVGDKTAANTQNAIMLYDHADFVLISDVQVFFLNGACFSAGRTKNDPTAFVRESVVRNLACFWSGPAAGAAVELSSTTANGSDATNEIKFFGLDVFSAPNVGLQVHNTNNFSATRLIEFHSVRIEKSGADDIQIGATGDAGQTAQIKFYGVQAITPGAANAGFYGINIGLGSLQAYDIQVHGSVIGPCWQGAACNGLKVDNVRLAKIGISGIATVGTNVTYTARVGSNVVLDASGAEAGFTYLVDPAAHVVSPAYTTLR